MTGFSTDQIHAGAGPEGEFGARITPIYLSAGFVFDDFDHAEARFAGTEAGYVYSRINNPTNAAVEKKIAHLEGGTGAILVGSGQAAVTVGLLGVLKAGDHFLSAPSIYEGTRSLFRDNFGRFGIEVEFIEDPLDLDEWRAKIRPATRLLYGEAIPNPKNDLIDFEAIAGLAHEHGLPFAIDSTVPTPYLFRPIDFGADIVVHSASKFLAGQGASLGGVVVDAGRFDWAARPDLFPHLAESVDGADGPSFTEKFGKQAYFAFTRGVIASRLGPSLSPFNAFLLQQGLETLSLRLERHASNALAIARWLESRPEVESVDYPGLESNPSYALAQKYLPRGAGSVFAFTLAAGKPAARAVIDSVEVFTRMTHIGDVRSLILHPSTTTHHRLPREERESAGITDGLVRLSVGLEDADDLIADLEQALDALATGSTGAKAPTGRRITTTDEAVPVL
ncbi:O-acetylhomoserine (thiol)-lyase [Frondihabitans sucicola]|uniref:O-acetylhomoserine (Thiol)-lyase n=1 Tax=Frondihabitans sucicola TaxID=1268041 RepID=A0ABM8GUA1_9MICO|nr:O-acetylhomoserine aminocarboxypropyltransferase/cysteine synthase family protein [Frondihabitans sucicola]BDZ52008.1 O-acetylhomoserine (thiol)-lyase [Frondihabitans sucicola]